MAADRVPALAAAVEKKAKRPLALAILRNAQGLPLQTTTSFTNIDERGARGEVGTIVLSRATLRKMHQNLWWATGHNVVAFPHAAGVFYPFLLSPEIAALSMSGSSALVALNALLLKRVKRA